MRKDTIAAIATAMSNSGIGIVRISGEESLNIIQKACELMRQGYIDVNPLKDACLYCPAKTLCGFDDTRVVAERKIPAVKETNISLILKED